MARRIPVLVDNTKSPPFPVMETLDVMLYLLKKFDQKDTFGFKDELQRSQCLQWFFFWHDSGRPIEGQLNWFGKLAPQKDKCQISEGEMQEFPHLLKWIARIGERLAVKNGTAKSWGN
ncbi:related to URE2-nitrogen catabolite repression regulator [Phialocephala subalpina]|uniref:Related to URE2-nitrogen catabolite repression regulator n=1 Tax=Phialocephala subalpina TaxID=576137 RepID=A0A1L7WT74_9HELO|nr:related to URE2-nitrogen catabolite repression regulator [Phialocephala subalpina]